jgi:hypothetical protein
MFFMRNLKSFKMLQDTLLEWKNNGSKTRLSDMLKLTDPDSRNRVKKLLEGMTNWRRSKSFDDVGKLEEVTALVKDVLASFSWWNGKGGRSSDPNSSGDEIESASAYSKQVAEAPAWLNDPEGFKLHNDGTITVIRWMKNVQNEPLQMVKSLQRFVTLSLSYKLGCRPAKLGSQ